MSNSVHNEDLLVRYIDGELSATEKAAVEVRLKNDAVFREQYQNLQVALQAIRQLGTRQQVETIHHEMMQELKGKKAPAKVVRLSRAVRYTMAVAASILVLFVGVRLYLATQQSPDRIYNETFVDFNVANARSSANQLSQIETLYQNKDFRGVAATTRAVSLSAKDSLLIGLSYLHTEDWQAAARWFHTVSVTENEYRQDAEFYLALAYLKTKEFAKAQTLFQRIYNNPAHIYHEQVSADLLADVKKLESH
ncbi:anti-sigma factor [Flavisolibacter nicotianae]|uniref:hypothetical protein n=1 Tax=Flavisolibacter nicotianae TaxID=2364882 RepID=UPI000EAF4045|nr:hypothetical protein [Flavisolibacter nicotianae]